MDPSKDSSDRPPDASARDALQRFESLGSNCEFGLMQRHFGVESVGLLRWGSFVNGFPALISALNFRLANAGHQLDYHVNGTEYISVDLTYGIVFHTDRHVGHIEPDKLLSNERDRISYLARNLIEDIEQNTKILVYKSNQELAEADIHVLHSTLNSISPVALLWVCVSEDDNKIGSCELLAPNLIKGYIDCFAPEEDVGSRCSFDIWLKLCQGTIEFVSGAG